MDEPIASIPSQGNKPRVLIVEDDMYIADVYSRKFDKEGFDVFIAEDGKIGLEKALEWHPHVILLDIMLPEIDGMDVLRALKENDSTRMIPVIMWTNKSEPEEARTAKELGAVDYLVKVFNMPAEVVDKVKQRIVI